MLVMGSTARMMKLTSRANATDEARLMLGDGVAVWAGVVLGVVGGTLMVGILSVIWS